MQALVDLVRDHLVPAFDRPGSPAAEAELADRIDGLRIPAVSSAPGAAPGERVEAVRTGTGGPTDLAPAYDRVVVAEDARSISLHRAGRWYDVALGDGDWAGSTWRRALGEGPATATLPLAASGGWVDDRRLLAEVLVVETAHRFTVELRRDPDGTAEVTLRWRWVPLNGPDPWDSAARGHEEAPRARGRGV